MRNFKNQSGQVGLVVLLIMATMLTVGIGTVTQSTRDLKITRQEIEASQVFNAAESGIEAGLADVGSGAYSGGSYTRDIVVDGVNVNYQIQGVTNLDVEVEENEVAYLDTGYGEVNANLTGRSVSVGWANGDICPNAAGLVIKIFNSISNSVETRGVTKCNRNDGLTLDGDGLISLSLRNGDEFVRIRSVYASTILTVTSNGSGWNLPVQYHSIVARANRSTSNETKVIQLDKTIETLPSVFDYAVFSGTSINM